MLEKEIDANEEYVVQDNEDSFFKRPIKKWCWLLTNLNDVNLLVPMGLLWKW